MKLPQTQPAPAPKLAIPPTQTLKLPEKITGEGDDYKSIRLREMATMWKGTNLEPYTVTLLSMLLQEDGTLTAERRHDCKKGVCYSIGFMGHHICHRGTPIVEQNAGKPFQKFCYWKDDKSPQQQFEEAYPDFSTNWETQFEEYTIRASGWIADGGSVNSFIRSWNFNEGPIRLQRVASHNALVKKALGI